MKMKALQLFQMSGTTGPVRGHIPEERSKTAVNTSHLITVCLHLRTAT